MRRKKRERFEDLNIGALQFYNRTAILFVSLLPATKLRQSNIFGSVCQEFCPHGMGVHGRGVCMVGGYVWKGGMHGRGHVW